METIEIRNIYGEVLFTHTCENNTILITLLEAIKSSADLSGANLSSANLSGADLRSAIGSEFAIAMTRICPEGDIIGWKKCREGVIVKLCIPAEAKRNNAMGRKCRAEYADVLEVFGAEEGISDRDENVVYKVGSRVFPNSYDENFLNECSSGIHFFITRLEAEKYDL